MSTFSIVGLCETWSKTNSQFCDLLPSHVLYSTIRKKRRKKGRCAGGLCVFVNKTLEKHIKHVYSYNKDIEVIVLSIDRCLFSAEKDILFCYVYIPPINSVVYTSEENGINIFETVLLTLSVKFNDPLLIVAGDLNSRTGNTNDFIVNDSCVNTPFEEWYTSDNFSIPRSSKDSVVNLFGLSLAELCCTFNLHILNGRSNDDLLGEYTFTANDGKSTVDYFITSTNLFPYIECFKVDNLDESDHFPIICKFQIDSREMSKNDHHVSNTAGMEVSNTDRYKWDNSKAPIFLDTLTDDYHSEKLLECMDSIECDINISIDKFVNTVKSAASSMKTQKNKYKPRNQTIKWKNKQPAWWNEKCDKAKCDKYTALKKFRTTNSGLDWQDYCVKKRTFKNLCNSCKIRSMKEKRKHVLSVKNDPEKFWKLIKSNTGAIHQINITADRWYNYFKTLLNQKVSISAEYQENVSDYLLSHEAMCFDCTLNDPVMLNTEISYKEITDAIKSLATNKSPGTDMLQIEFFKCKLLFSLSGSMELPHFHT